MRFLTALVGLSLLLAPSGLASQSDGRRPAPPIRIMHGHVKVESRDVGSIRMLRDRGALGRIVAGELRARGRVSMAAAPGSRLSGRRPGGHGHLFHGVHRFHHGDPLFGSGLRIGSNGILLSGPPLGLEARDPFGLRKHEHRGPILRLRSIRVGRAIVAEAAELEVGEHRAGAPGVGTGVRFEPAEREGKRAPADPETVREGAVRAPPVCVQARVQAVARAVFHLQLDARQLGAASAAEAERRLQDRMRRAGVLRLEGLDGGSLSLPGSLVEEINVRPCPGRTV